MANPASTDRSASRAMRWPLGLVVLCGLLLGYYFVRTWVVPLPREYQLDFGAAQWIEPSAPGPVGYFRKNIFISAAPEQAWLEIAASDNYECIVNGHTVGNESSVKTRVAGIYDIKKRLKPGKNVIAASISRTSFPGSAQLLVRGFVKEPGKTTSFVSDPSWKATVMTGIVDGTEDWTSPLVDDQRWPDAQLSAIGTPWIRRVTVNPQVFRLQPAGKWLLTDDAASEATFSGSFKGQGWRPDAWIQVASSGDLDLLINGHLVTPAIPAPPAGKQLPHLPASETHEEEINPRRLVENPANSTDRLEPTTLEAYDISRWVKRGTNSVVATVRADHRPASFFADGFVMRNGTPLRFETDKNWQASRVARDGEARAAIEGGGDGAAPWGFLPQEPARPVAYPVAPTIIKALFTLTLALLGTILFWLLMSGLVASSRGETLRRVLVRDGLLHSIVIVTLLLLLLPGYDPRFAQDWPFQSWVLFLAIVVLLAVRLFHFFSPERASYLQRRVAAAGTSAVDYVEGRVEAIREIGFRPSLPYLLLFLIMALGFGLRYAGHDFMSFDHDEMGLIAKSKGIYKLGFPYTDFAGQVRPLTTYELVPYPLAFVGLFFGYSEWSLRLPSCIMGMLTIGVMALFGRRLFGWRTGLWAAFIYACIPLNIRWAQNAFYPQQCQFMAMLTAWLFYEATLERPFRRRYLTGAAIAFCATYLSWEGTAFLLPALFIGLMVIRWGEWWWLKEFHLYRCLFCMIAVVVAEYCYRTLAGFPYLQIGSGLSNLTGPSLFFLKAAYQPLFYVNKLLLAENHVFFTILLALGLFLCWNHRGFRYVSSIVITLVICHTNFLAALSPRYCYYYQAMLVLGGVGAAGLLYDRFLLVARDAGDAIVTRFVAHCAGLGLMAVLFLQSNESVFKEYRLASESDTPGLMTRLNTYRYDYRGVAHFVRDHLEPGDVVLPGIPHVYQFYSGLPGDYFLNTLLSSKVPYNQRMDEPVFVDKFGGLPVIRNLNELLEVTHRARRTWLIFAPYASFEKLNDPEVLDYVHKNARVLFETYRAKVLLIEGANKTQGLVQTQ